MEELTLLRDLAVVMALGGATTALFHRLRQPVVLGYILAGVLIGPHTPPFAFVRDPHSIEILAELGVILLLFSLGLEFSLRRLRRVGGVAVIGASLEIPLMVWIGYSIARLAGWGQMDSLFLGAILSISSTTIIVKALMELGLTRAEFARVIMGILIVEDLAAVLILVLLSGLASAGAIAVMDLVQALLRVGLFVVTVTVLGFLLLPRLLHWLARLPAREVLTISVLGLCFGVAILAGELGFSVALGAFLVGAVMAESREARLIEQRIEPIRDMFSAMFFVAVGLSIDISVLRDRWALVLILSAVTVVGKVVACTFATMVAGYSPRTAFRVGMGLAQIGEFSFIIANLGRSAGVLSDFVYPVTVGVSAITTLLTPYLIRSSDAVAEFVGRGTPRGLKSFLEFYDRRLSGLRRRTRDPWMPADARGPMLRVSLATALLFALVLLARAAAGLVREDLVQGSFGTQYANVVVWAVAGIVSVPLLVSAWRAAGDFSRALYRRLTGRSEGSRVVVETFRFALSVIAGLLFLAVASPFFPTGFPFVATSLLVALSGLVFWRSLVAVHEDAERALGEIFSAADPDESAPERVKQELSTLVSQKYSFEVVLEDFILPFSATSANRTIRELALRSRSGATIAAIYREEKAIVNPGPETRLEPGDVLLLLGSREQVQAAIQALEALAAPTA